MPVKEKAFKTPPGPPKGLFGFRTMIPYYRDYLGYLQNLQANFGDIAFFRAGKEKVYLINEPALIEEILVKKPRLYLKGTGYQRAKLILGDGLLTTDSENHANIRLSVQPAFHKASVENLFSIIKDNSADMINRWKEKAQVEIHDEAVQLFLNIICRALFSSDNTAALAELGKTFSNVFNNYGLFLLAFPGITSKFPLPAVKKFKETKKKFDEIIYDIIKTRRKRKQKPNDILTLLLEAQMPNGDLLSDEQVRDELVTIFFAAHDTSAKTFTWAMYLLAQNQGCANSIEKIREETTAAGISSAEDIKQLKYTKAVVSESLRLFPPAHSIARIASDDTNYKDYLIEKDSSLLIIPYILHRDERHFTNPGQFIPGRWLSGGKPKKMSFLPFGAGNRGCIGESFAWMQLITAVAMVCEAYDLSLVPGQKIVPSASITLKPKYGIQMNIIPRK